MSDLHGLDLRFAVFLLVYIFIYDPCAIIFMCTVMGNRRADCSRQIRNRDRERERHEIENMK